MDIFCVLIGIIYHVWWHCGGIVRHRGFDSQSALLGNLGQCSVHKFFYHKAVSFGAGVKAWKVTADCRRYGQIVQVGMC